MKTLGIVGLGLIGSSFAKAYEQSDEWRILGYDIDEKINQFAILAEDIEDVLNEENVGECDLILLAVYPEAAIEWLRKMAPHISKETMVIDCCGVKGVICPACFEIADEYGFT